MNTVIITRRLIREAESKQTRNGKAYADFAISVYDGKDSNGQTKTFIVNVRAWDCELTPQLTKGTMACITGRLKIEEYNDKKYTKVETTGFDSVAIIPQRSKPQNDYDGGTDDIIPF